MGIIRKYWYLRAKRELYELLRKPHITIEENQRITELTKKIKEYENS